MYEFSVRCFVGSSGRVWCLEGVQKPPLASKYADKTHRIIHLPPSSILSQIGSKVLMF